MVRRGRFSVVSLDETAVGQVRTEQGDLAPLVEVDALADRLRAALGLR